MNEPQVIICPNCHKQGFASLHRAKIVRKRLSDRLRIYWHHDCRLFHLTNTDRQKITRRIGWYPEQVHRHRRVRLL
jgi:hypothetical protein